MLKTSWTTAGAASVLALIAAGSAGAQTVSADQVDRLQSQIKALEGEIQALKGKVGNAQKTADRAFAATPPKPAAPPPTAVAKMSPGNRPSICTVNAPTVLGKAVAVGGPVNCIAFTSRLHLDFGGYDYRPNTASTNPQRLDNGVNARRARIGVLGTFMDDWNYALIYDFGGTSDGFGGSIGVGGALPPAGAPVGTSSSSTANGLLPGGAASGIENAYLSYTGFKPFGGQLALEGGYMDVPYTLDEAMSSNDILFMERASSQVIAANIAAGDNRSAAGARWFNDWFWAGAYATGPTSGAIHQAWNANPNGQTEQYGAFARAALQLVNRKDATLHIGGDFEWLGRPAFNNILQTQTLTLNDRPELRIDPATIVSTGAITNVVDAKVYSVEAAATYGPFFAQGEYFWYSVERSSGTGLPALNFQGGYVEAAVALTGETHTYNSGAAAYNGIVPAHPFTLTKGGWGAWEIAGRYSVIDLNDRIGFADGAAGGKQKVYTAGLNWYVNRNIRFMFNYLHGTIDKQASATSFTDTGAKFDAFAMRTQVAF